MVLRQPLSEAISEGDAISMLVHVRGAGEAVAAEAAGAEGIKTNGVVEGLRAATMLPILVAGVTPEDASRSGADAWLLVAETDADALEQRYALARELGLECVVDVRDDEELELVLTRIDPEIVLLSPRAAERDEDAVDRVLELLPDVPAGKLVAAELMTPSAAGVTALESAGVDAVLVGPDAM